MNDHDYQAARERARVNRERLEACPLHRFERGEKPWMPWKCSSCGGTVTPSAARGYLDGIRTALADPEGARTVVAKRSERLDGSRP